MTMPTDEKDNPTGQDGRQQPKPSESATNAESKEPPSVREIHKYITVAIAFVLGVAAMIAIPLGIRAWMESQIDNAVDAKVRSILSDETILRKIAAESHPSLIFDASGSILQDMGAAQYVKPDDIRMFYQNYSGTVAPSKLHVGFMRPVSFAPIVTSLRDPASITASHGKGLDWEFDITWTVLAGEGESTNASNFVFRLELVP